MFSSMQRKYGAKAAYGARRVGEKGICLLNYKTLTRAFWIVRGPKVRNS